MGTSKAKKEARRFLVRVINERSMTDLKQAAERRQEPRVELNLAVCIVPLENGQPDVSNAFYAVTKDITATGVGVLTDHAIASDEVLLRFLSDSDARYLRAEMRFTKPIGAGFQLYGTEIVDLFSTDGYFDLRELQP